MIQKHRPDIVICDVMMPVMDGLDLAEKCREVDNALPVFIMLTSYEEFNYVKRSLRLGAVEYLVKMDLTPELLESALRRAIESVKKERALRAPETVPAPSGLEQYRDRLFIQLYGGLFQDRDYFDSLCSQLGLHFDSPWYTMAAARFTCRDLPTEQLATLSAGVTNMAADVLPKYLPCTVTASNLGHFYVLLPLDSPVGLEQRLDEVLKKTGQILFNYFSTPVHWAVGQPVQDILKVQQSQRTALSILTQVTDEQPVLYYQPQATTPAPRRAQTVAQIQEYICHNLSKPLSLNDVAAVFNFSPNYLSQLFSQNGESSFVEFVTATRINTAKELMATTDLKIYEISERVGFESSSYFSKVFKKLEGVSPREYMQRLQG
ncbi:MAG: helix-turn-helix domain-containing protein [Clostridiales bacterium]|nr:helix-turn-helix domain-containing protein [Clostridiales bacterium]